MAKTVVINSVVYPDCGEVDIPLQGGGTAKYMDTDLNNGATASDIRNGKSAVVNGSVVNGNLTTVVVSQDGTTKVLSIS